MFFPATACLVQERIGAKKAWGFDLSAACSGFAYALTVGGSSSAQATHKKVLAIGSDTILPSWTIRIVRRVFCSGDGAGAALLEAAGANEGSSILSTMWMAQGGISLYAGRRFAPSFEPGDGREASALCPPGRVAGFQIRSAAHDGNGNAFT